MPDESLPLRANTLGHAERLYVVSADKITLAEIDLSGVELRPSATWRALSQIRVRVVSDSRIPVDVDRSTLICTWCVT
jgi:hypothetical protein